LIAMGIIALAFFTVVAINQILPQNLLQR